MSVRAHVCFSWLIRWLFFVVVVDVVVVVVVAADVVLFCF